MARTLEDVVKHLIRIIRTGGSAGRILGDLMLRLRDDVINQIVRAIRNGAPIQDIITLARAGANDFREQAENAVYAQAIEAAEKQVRSSRGFLALLSERSLATINTVRITTAWVTRVFSRPMPDSKVSVFDLVESSTLNIRQRIVGITRDAYFRGTTTQEIARIFRDSADDTITDSSVRRNAEAIARSAISTVANQARLDTFQANGDLVTRILFMATLDHRTSDICMVTDGKVWRADDPKALIPPLHVNCRSTVVPILKGETVQSVKDTLSRPSVIPKSQEQLERQGLTTRTGRVRKPSRTDRSPLTGKVVAEYVNYEQWLKTQPKYYQREILGKSAYERFQETGSLRRALGVATL